MIFILAFSLGAALGYAAYRLGYDRGFQEAVRRWTAEQVDDDDDPRAA